MQREYKDGEVGVDTQHFQTPHQRAKSPQNSLKHLPIKAYENSESVRQLKQKQDILKVIGILLAIVQVRVAIFSQEGPLLLAIAECLA